MTLKKHADLNGEAFIYWWETTGSDFCHFIPSTTPGTFISAQNEYLSIVHFIICFQK